jgi:hypothetical protein
MLIGARFVGAHGRASSLITAMFRMGQRLGNEPFNAP